MGYGVIYCRKFPNNKVYIGQTIQKPQYRWSQAKWVAKRTNSNELIYRALRKYNYQTEDIILYKAKTEWELNFAEALIIKMYNSTNHKLGYNIKLGGNSSPHSKETKEKLSKLRKGIKFSNEHKKNLSKAKKNVKFSQNHKTNIGKGHTKKLYKIKKNFLGFYKSYFFKRNKKRQWYLVINYNKNKTYIGSYIDPLTPQIIFDLIKDEIY